MLDLRQKGKAPGRQIVAISDNAKYHHARVHQPWREDVAKEFQLYFLPPYSPELNPIERVWKLARRNGLHNRYFAHLEEVIEAVEDSFLK